MNSSRDDIIYLFPVTVMNLCRCFVKIMIKAIVVLVTSKIKKIKIGICIEKGQIYKDEIV